MKVKPDYKNIASPNLNFQKYDPLTRNWAISHRKCGAQSENKLKI